MANGPPSFAKPMAVLGALIVGLLGWLCPTMSMAGVPAPASTSVAHTYDSHRLAADPTYTTTERGSPTAYDHTTTTYHAVENGLRGASERPDAAAVSARYDDDHPGPLLQDVGLPTAPDGHEAGAWTPPSRERVGVATNTAARGGDDLARLYRAVEPGGLKDIMRTGVYRSAPGGAEGKYFFPTKAQAQNFSKMASERYGTGPYCITSGCIPMSALRGVEPVTVGTEGTVYFVPDDLLPYFNNVVIHGP